MIIDTASWLIVEHPDEPPCLGKIHHILFDFDGTLSLLREGWEAIMAPMMIEMISPESQATEEMVNEVQEYIDRSTGILTIRQMEWLTEAVKRYGIAQKVKSPQEYKSIYVQQIRQKVAGRRQALEGKKVSRSDLMVPGTVEFLELLKYRGVKLYLASGTDHDDVVSEASTLKLDGYFSGRIYGALDASESNDKEMIIQRILKENRLAGEELLVIGDGPVEIRVAKRSGAIALGAATDEVSRHGWNLRKVARLRAANADFLVYDFSRARELADFLEI